MTGGKLGSPGVRTHQGDPVKGRSHMSFFVEAAKTWTFSRVLRPAMYGHDAASDED